MPVQSLYEDEAVVNCNKRQIEDCLPCNISQIQQLHIGEHHWEMVSQLFEIYCTDDRLFTACAMHEVH